MANRGRYKYICEDCDAENWLTHKDRGSRFKPRCVECGSTWLKPSSRSRGPKKIVTQNDVFRGRKEIQDRKMGKD